MRPIIVALALALVLQAQGQTSRPRIAVAGISHESNSFNPSKTDLSEFRRVRFTPNPEVLKELAQRNDMLAGYAEGALRHGFDLYPTLIAVADPKGPVTDQAFNSLMSEMLEQLKKAPKLDGLLLENHGAMVVESYPVGDAEMLHRLRKALGPAFPIVVTHDFHANVSPEIVRDSTVLITYKENPHIDTKERGVQAARIMAGIISGKLKPVQVVTKPEMLYNIVFQYTRREPLLPIVQESRRLEQDPKILAVSVSAGYQYADSPAMGPSVTVVTDNDEARARKEADRLAQMLWNTRDQLTFKLPDPAEAVRQAKSAEKFPVALMDMGDNIGGGSAGDSTFILGELLRQKAEGWVVAIADPAAVQAAIRSGIGGVFDQAVGGKTDRLHGDPVRVRGRVKSLHDGRFIETEVRHGGGRYHDQGHTAVIEVDGSTPDLANLLMLTSERGSPNSLHQLISCGIYPQRQRILVAKGAIAPRAAYEPIAARIIEVDSPGATAVNPARFKYTRVRRPLFGLDSSSGR